MESVVMIDAKGKLRLFVWDGGAELADGGAYGGVIVECAVRVMYLDHRSPSF